MNPTYKEDWEVPGGMAEVGESPRAAARREVREELGLDVAVGRLLVLDWNPPGYLPDDGLMLLYQGGELEARQIRLAEDELSDWCWCTQAMARERLLDFKARRVIAGMLAYEDNHFVELEDGYPVSSQSLR